ncbi:MAG: hypothetical protein LBE01_04030, partial [Deltaproteobacteria bacterium]|nr:hypothetical protein [Deltaproteobacteria bacterium]
MDTSHIVPEALNREPQGLVGDGAPPSGSPLAGLATDRPAQAADDAPQSTNLWELVKAEFALSLDHKDFEAWIKPIKADQDGSSLSLTVPHRFFFNWIKDYYLEDIQAKLRRLSLAANPKATAVEAVLVLPPATAVAPAAPAAAAASPAGPPAPPQKVVWPTEGPFRLNPSFTFENFVPGDSNRLAYEATRAFARGDDLGTDILLLAAAHGLGKSHLVQALAQSYMAKRPNKRVFYLATEHFTNEFVNSFKNQLMEGFKNKYRLSCDLLLIEDLAFLCGKSRFQEEFNYTLDLLLNHGKKIVLTSPQDLRGLTQLCPQLKSKMNSALLAPIGPPDFETRVAILTQQAMGAGVALAPPILELLAERLLNDVRLLEGCLMAISANCRLLGQPVNMELAKKCLATVQASVEGELSAERIIKLVCQNFHIGEADIASASRRGPIKEARAL